MKWHGLAGGTAGVSIKSCLLDIDMDRFLTPRLGQLCTMSLSDDQDGPVHIYRVPPFLGDLLAASVTAS